MEIAIIALCVTLGLSVVIIVVARISTRHKKGSKKQTALPPSVKIKVMGENVVIPVPSTENLQRWGEAKEANEANPDSCETIPQAGEILVSVSFFNPHSGLTGWAKYENYWNAYQRAGLYGFQKIAMPEKDYTEAKEYIAENKHREALLSKTVKLNNKGIELEKAGDIDTAIFTYEQCIELGYPAMHSFRRLVILYRKKKDTANEIRVIKAALETFPNDTFFETRLSRLLARV